MPNNQVSKSHIQISQGVLRQFSHKKKEELNGFVNVCDAVYVLSLLTGKISEEKVATFGTQADYYSLNVEKELSETIEGPFGEVTRKIRSSPNDSYSALTSGDIVAIQRYIKASIVRAPRNHNDPQVNSIAQSLGITLTPSISVEFLLSRLDALKPFPNTGMILIKNTSPTPFVVPFNCLSIMNLERGDKIFFPFHPKFCFALVPLEDFDKTPGPIDLATTVFETSKDVENVNNLSIGTELVNQKMIVGSEENELKRIYVVYQKLLQRKIK